MERRLSVKDNPVIVFQVPFDDVSKLKVGFRLDKIKVDYLVVVFGNIISSARPFVSSINELP